MIINSLLVFVVVQVSAVKDIVQVDLQLSNLLLLFTMQVVIVELPIKESTWFSVCLQISTLVCVRIVSDSQPEEITCVNP